MSETLSNKGQQVDFFLQERADMVGLKMETGETLTKFRSRVAGALRTKGYIIEAHEAQSGKLYDDPDQGPTGPMTGIFGAVAQIMQGKSYSSDPERKIGDDIASGVIMQNENHTQSALSAIFSLLGPESGMDIINGLTAKPKSQVPTPREKPRKKPRIG